MRAVRSRKGRPRMAHLSLATAMMSWRTCAHQTTNLAAFKLRLASSIRRTSASTPDLQHAAAALADHEFQATLDKPEQPPKPYCASLAIERRRMDFPNAANFSRESNLQMRGVGGHIHGHVYISTSHLDLDLDLQKISISGTGY